MQSSKKSGLLADHFSFPTPTSLALATLTTYDINSNT